MGLFTTPTPRMSAGWTASGACTSGSTARPRGATRRGSGGAAMTSMTRDERDADVGRDMAPRRGVVPCHVDRDDGGDDATIPGPGAVALPPGRTRSADRARGRRLLRRLDSVRYGRLSARSRAAEHRPDRRRCDRPAGWLPPAHRVEGVPPRVLPGGTRARPYTASRRRHGLATWPARRPLLQPVLRRSDGHPA